MFESEFIYEGEIKSKVISIIKIIWLVTAIAFFFLLIPVMTGFFPIIFLAFLSIWLLILAGITWLAFNGLPGFLVNWVRDSSKNFLSSLEKQLDSDEEIIYTQDIAQVIDPFDPDNSVTLSPVYLTSKRIVLVSQGIMRSIHFSSQNKSKMKDFSYTAKDFNTGMTDSGNQYIEFTIENFFSGKTKIYFKEAMKWHDYIMRSREKK